MISIDIVQERGYMSILGKAELKNLGVSGAQLHTPGIRIPAWGVDGQKTCHIYRPDNPRVNTH
jgi:hypothetical protein